MYGRLPKRRSSYVRPHLHHLRQHSQLTTAAKQPCSRRLPTAPQVWSLAIATQKGSRRLPNHRNQAQPIIGPAISPAPGTLHQETHRNRQSDLLGSSSEIMLFVHDITLLTREPTKLPVSWGSSSSSSGSLSRSSISSSRSEESLSSSSS